MTVKEESEKVGLKLNIQKMKIMASGPITSWQIHGGTVEVVSDSIFWVSKITEMVIAAMKLKDTYSLDSIFKSTYYFAKKGPSSQGYDFSNDHVWM